METAEDYNRDRLHDELYTLTPNTPSQQAIIVGIDANAKMGLKQQSDKGSSTPSAYASRDNPIDVGRAAKAEDEDSCTSARLRSDEEHYGPRNGSPTSTDMAGLKNEECRKKFRQRVSDAAKKKLPVLASREKLAFASAKTVSAYNSVCVAGDLTQEKRLRRKLHRQLNRDRDRENEWTSRAKEFEVP
ncbi:hypothetical protein RB195_007207 [Necator americanus]|uniref:Uncharacterized protein n=1 Tax=Necator americanus TaxID=51031 RepID=A0ABR1BZ73_NECAM